MYRAELTRHPEVAGEESTSLPLILVATQAPSTNWAFTTRTVMVIEPWTGVPLHVYALLSRTPVYTPFVSARSCAAVRAYPVSTLTSHVPLSQVGSNFHVCL